MAQNGQASCCMDDVYEAKKSLRAVQAGKGFFKLLSVWYQRWTTRRHLALLDARALEDIGIDTITAAREADKPFWMA